MAGIHSYGVYIPVWRISRDEIARSVGSASMRGERAVAFWDEDSLTMGVEAGLDCLRGIDRNEIDALYFASVSAPYREKQTSSLIASVLGLRRDVFTSDFAGSLRSGTLAVKAAVDGVMAGTLRKALVIASDCRAAMPRSDAEQAYGDGAVAFLIGDDGGSLGVVKGFSTVIDPIPGPWRREEDRYNLVFDLRIDTRYGILKNIPEAVRSLLSGLGVEAGDISKFALYGPDARTHNALAGQLKIDAKTQLQHSLLGEVGATGSAHCLLLLAAAIDQAGAGDRIVCASCGEGSDAFMVRVAGSPAVQAAGRSGVALVGSKRLVPTYGRFLTYKKEIEVGWPEWERSSVAKYWRDEDWLLPLRGMKCRKCGTLQYPVRRVCTMCREKDDYDLQDLAHSGTVYTFTHDYLLGPGNRPADGINAATRVLIELDDGCRIWLEMTDHDTDEISVGIPVELTFRLLHEKSDYRFYGWKARPPRSKAHQEVANA